MLYSYPQLLFFIIIIINEISDVRLVTPQCESEVWIVNHY